MRPGGGVSLRRRLLMGLVLVSLSFWVVIAWITVQDSVEDVDELFDAHLAQTAWAMLRLADPDDIPSAMPPGQEPGSPAVASIFSRWAELPERMAAARAAADPGAPSAASDPGTGLTPASMRSLREAYDRNLRYQVWSGNGTLLLRSANAPPTAMAPRDGFSESVDSQGRSWRQYGVSDRHGDFRILVAEAPESRNRLLRQIALHTAMPLLLGMPVLVVLLWLSITKALAPLGKVAREIQREAPDSLQPLQVDDAPREVQPMVRALNTLLERINRAMDGERLFTAHAAHELRTPLAGIQAQLHLARVASNEDERERALQQLQRGVDRAIRLVGQMLTLARLDPEQALPQPSAVSLGAVAEGVCAELAPLALQKEQTLELSVDDGLPPVSGDEDMLGVLLRNLVDNAIRYTAASGRIDIALQVRGGLVSVTVSDDGPGIPEADRQRVFDRFVRLAGHLQPGTGLGLAICRRIAELHAATIHMAPGSGDTGLRVSVGLRAIAGP
jgi:two-component system sensor histidine kinase QseC